MPRGNPKEQITTRLDPALKREATDMAESEGRKLTNVIEELLGRWVKRKRRGTLQESENQEGA
jgi:hypothetical protein